MTPPSLSRLHDLQINHALAQATMDHLRPRFDAMRTRHEDGTAPQAVSAHQLFQTPEALAARLVALLNLTPQDRLLEPSAGLGRIIRAALPYQPREVLAVEVDKALAGHLYASGLPITLKQADFLSLHPATTGRFECIAMNPPFTMRSDILHILHAINFLAPGGRLAGLCMAGPAREKAIKPLCRTWERIPGGTFEGTGVETVLFSIHH